MHDLLHLHDASQPLRTAFAACTVAAFSLCHAAEEATSQTPHTVDVVKNYGSTAESLLNSLQKQDILDHNVNLIIEGWFSPDNEAHAAYCCSCSAAVLCCAAYLAWLLK